MSLLDRRLVYAPFEYPEAHEFWKRQQMAHWLPYEVPMGADIADWHLKLNESERSIIGRTLKGFTQLEVVVEDYWSCRVSRWFKKPEIQMTASCFGSMESCHAVAYAYLQETLGMTDFDAFLYEPSAKARIDRLMMGHAKSKEEIARSLAIFSGFTEGVSLFSSFAILMSFSLRNLLKGVGQIVAWSCLDEALHSDFGCWLFRTFVSEYPEVLTETLREELYEAARLTALLEDNFINQSFRESKLPSLDPSDLKEYIRYRINVKLQDLGLSSIYQDLDMTKVNKLDWFAVLTSGVEMQDFFAGRVTAYAKSVADFSEVWESSCKESQAA